MLALASFYHGTNVVTHNQHSLQHRHPTTTLRPIRRSSLHLFMFLQRTCDFQQVSGRLVQWQNAWFGTKWSSVQSRHRPFPFVLSGLILFLLSFCSTVPWASTKHTARTDLGEQLLFIFLIMKAVEPVHLHMVHSVKNAKCKSEKHVTNRNNGSFLTSKIHRRKSRLT